MVKPLLRELAGPFPSHLLFDEHWESLLDLVPHLWRSWNRVCQDALDSGSADQLHANRHDYQSLLLAWFKCLDGIGVLAEYHPEGRPPEFLIRWNESRDLLQKHYDSLFPRWQTIDDLEAILLERISLPNEQLKALAAKYPAPAAWYNEPDEPAAKE
jgi:hypothetical protein